MKTTVVSLGGSLIVPDKVDVGFLKKLRSIILVRKNERFVITVGGGKPCRDYQEAAKKLGVKNKTDLDMIGIASTRFSAELVRAIFMPHAYEKVVENPTKKVNTNKKIVVCSGWKPGFSTDKDAVMLAKRFKAKKIINLTNVDYVYDKDPKKYKNAKPIKKISWNKFFKIVGKKWKPGMHLPFDPVASRQAKKHRIKVVVMNGRKLNNFKNLLAGKRFTGTVIS